MFRKLFVFILITVATCAAVFAQSPESKKANESLVQAYSLAFGNDGGYLGIQTLDVTKENFGKYGLREVRGVAVEKVVDNSPAHSAGIRVGDVIVSINGDEITSVKKLTRLISEIAPDHQVRIDILRNGAKQELNATLGKRPAPAFANGNFEFKTGEPLTTMKIPELEGLMKLKDLPKGEMPKVFTFPEGEGRSFAWTIGNGRQIGVGVTVLTKQLAEHFGVDGGVLINQVREDSPAARAGLRAGDIIVEADGKAVKGELDLVRTINDKKEGDIQITFVRDRNRQTISVTPERSKDGGFIFQTGKESSLTTAPGLIKVNPVTTVSPKIAPMPMSLTRTGRII